MIKNFFTLNTKNTPPMFMAAVFLAALFSASAWAGPNIQHWQTSNGAHVYFVENHDLPMLDVRVIFNAGSARDDGQYGISSLMNAQLPEGAGGKSAAQLSAAIENVGGQFSNSSGRDMASVAFRSLANKKSLQPVIDTVALMLTKPDFSNKAIERDRKAMLSGLKSRAQSVGSQASDAMYKAFYPGHPYAIGPHGTAKTIKAITRNHLIEFYKKYYVAKNAVIAIVGDASRKKAEDIATKLTQGLAMGHAAKTLPAPKEITSSKTIRLKFPSAQTHVFIGHPAVKRGMANWHAMYTGNHVLGGGGFTSILMDEIREKRGLSYSVYSYFSPMLAKGPFILGLQTANKNADQAIQLAHENLQRYTSNGPDKKSLDLSIKNITGSFPLKIDSNKKIAEYIAAIGFYNLPLNYLDTFSDLVSRLDKKTVRAAFQENVHPDKIITIIVGG
ncbi:MAG: insulinase family protein [Gammaproteobacteria bacterium]|nr:insulinase family protein [Gammaproteobacteria bacterium]